MNDNEKNGNVYVAALVFLLGVSLIVTGYSLVGFIVLMLYLAIYSK